MPALLLALILSVFAPAAQAAGLTLPVPAMTIYPGDVIDESMLTERSVSQAQLGRLMVVPDRAGLVGRVARRTLLPGRPVPVMAVAERALVARGAPVELVYRAGGLTILAQATALEEGSAGDVIRVRNADSGLIITATVQPDGTLSVGGT